MAGYDPATAGDNVLDQYADVALEYDSWRWVIRRAPAGQAASTYTYWTNYENPYEDYLDPPLDVAAINLWKQKALESRADGTQIITYTNCLGQTLLEDVGDGQGNQAVSYYEYNLYRQRSLAADPAAVAGYAESPRGLTVTFQPDTGAIHGYDYYQQTKLSRGAVAGKLQAEWIQAGAAGMPAEVGNYAYTGCTAAGRVNYFLASQTTFSGQEAGSAATTFYQYEYFPGTLQPAQKTTVLPAIPAAQNGSGTSNRQVERYDLQGRVVESVCPRGYVTRNAYDPATGAVVQTIQDAGGLNLTTDYEVDGQGRVTQVLGPVHAIPAPDNPQTATVQVRAAQWTVYRDRTDDDGVTWHETLTAQGYYQPDTGAMTLVNPVSISRTTDSNSRSEQIQAVRADAAGPLTAEDLFAQASYVRWSVSLLNGAGQQTASRTYHTLPAAGDGQEGMSYDQTLYGYDAFGRQNRVRSPGGTVTRTLFDTQGRAIATYVGTNDTGATDADPTGGAAPDNNMVCVSSQAYDAAGRLIQQTQHVDADAFHDRVTTTGYDTLGRVSSVAGPDGTQQQFVYDNLDRQIVAQTFAAGPAGLVLIARSDTLYDDLGRVYRTLTYVVDDDGTCHDPQAANTWYDCSGNAIKQQGPGSRVFTKTLIDSVGRTVEIYVGYDLDETAWAEAATLDGDTLFEQTETVYDAASNVIETVRRQRLHTATDDQTGQLEDLSTAPKARVSYAAAWYDGLGRGIASAAYGTNGNAPWTRPETIPDRSDTVLLSTTSYNDRGEAYLTVDPAGRAQQQTFDDSGRLVETIDNVQSGSTASDANRTVRQTYTPDGQWPRSPRSTPRPATR